MQGEYNIPEYSISVDQLQIGVFVRLEGLSWLNHPFVSQSFKIKSKEQVQIIKGLGIKKVICIPRKSDCLPLDQVSILPDAGDTPKTEQPHQSELTDQLWQMKKEKTELLKKKKEQIAQCEKKYMSSLKNVSTAINKVASGNFSNMPQVAGFVNEMAEYFLGNTESSLQLMNLGATEENVYYHSMNVAVLSLMLGREAGLTKEELNALGVGALFHDLGKSRIEKKVILKRTPLNVHELALLKLHPAYGLEMLKKAKDNSKDNEFDIPKEAVYIVYQHHELCDGSGYPKGVKTEQINRLARIVTIVDYYDNHCNHQDPKESLTPYHTLSFMYTKQKPYFDPNLLSLFVKFLGVFPPGSIVELNNGSIGIVLTINSEKPLYPHVLIYDPDIPKQDALIVDLNEDRDLKVEKSLRPAQLSKEIYDYLNPRTRITYYVDTTKDKVGKP